MIEITLTCEDRLIPLTTLVSVAAAINKQVQDEFKPEWKIDARVTASPTPADASRDSWVVMIIRVRDDRPLRSPPQATSDSPPAYVQFDCAWTFTASQTCLELAVNASGMKEPEASPLTVAVDGQVKEDSTQKVPYLLEICSACNSIDYGYLIDGWPVSDFALPIFYTGTEEAFGKYSFKGHLRTARRPLLGGYISWLKGSCVHQLQNVGNGPAALLLRAVSADASPRNISQQLAARAKLRPQTLNSEHPLLLACETARGQYALTAGDATPPACQHSQPAREFLFVLAGWLGMLVLLASLALLVLNFWRPLDVTFGNELPVPATVLLRLVQSALIAAIVVAGKQLAIVLRGGKSECRNKTPLPAPEPAETHEADERMRQQVRSFIVIFMLGNVLWMFTLAESVDGLRVFMNVLGTVGVLSGASMISGALLGFIFGVPRSVSDPASTPTKTPAGSTATDASAQSTPTPKVRANTNLEQISDWLTKLLVGVGLSKIEDVPSLLKRASHALEPAMSPLEHGGVVGVAICCAFGVAGFTWGYFEARTSLMKMFGNADSL